MTCSKRKRAANRINARLSAGPTSPEGKARSAKNAVRHGLNVPAGDDPALACEIDALAARFAQEAPACGGQARLAAQTYIQLRRVHRAKARAVDEAMGQLEPGDPTEAVVLSAAELLSYTATSARLPPR